MKNIKLSVLLMLGLQSMMSAAQESKSPENKMYHIQEIPTLQNIIARNILIDFNNKIDQDTPLSQHNFDGWIDYVTNHQILFKDVINDNIHSQDNKIVVQKGDLLRKASEKNNVHMVQLLLALGADIDIQAENGETPLHRAACTNSTEVVRILLDAGAHVNIQDNKGFTPLHQAVGHENAEEARMLINAGTDVNIQDNFGNTPLHWASWCHRREIIPVLINAGSCLNIQNINGITAQQLARNLEIEALFRQDR